MPVIVDRSCISVHFLQGPACFESECPYVQTLLEFLKWVGDSFQQVNDIVYLFAVEFVSDLFILSGLRQGFFFRVVSGI